MKKKKFNKKEKKCLLRIVFLFFLPGLLTFVISGCVKTNSCDCSEVKTGTWQYLEKPVYQQLHCVKKIKIVAVFITEEGDSMYFTNPVPLQYQSLTPTNIKLCAKDIEEGEITSPVVSGCLDIVYKLTCIEKEEE
jgi:hypothetical protein